MDKEVASTARFKGSQPKETPWTDVARKGGNTNFRGQVTKLKLDKSKQRP